MSVGPGRQQVGRERQQPLTGGADGPLTEEAPLIARVAAGDGLAWKAVVDRHLAAIVATAWHVTGDRGEAEDVAQETFVRLIKKAPDWQADGPPLRAWLHRVAVNLGIDRRRARRTVPLDDALPVADDANPDLIRNAAIGRVVGGALADLPQRQRAAIALVHFQGFSGQEAAGMLGVSIEALESLLARARRTLKAKLEPQASELLSDY